MKRKPNRNELSAGLGPVAKRLEHERPRATDLELDRIKLRALSGASRFGNRTFVKSGRVVSVAVAAVLIAGGGAVLAKNDPPPQSAASQSSASSSQYCPPSSQQPGNPKNPGPSKCGKPKTK